MTIAERTFHAPVGQGHRRHRRHARYRSGHCGRRGAQEGATVYIGARNMERAQAEADEWKAAGLAVKCVYNDASKPDSYQL